MATIKISQLTELAPLNGNTGNVSFVGTDTETGISGRYTAKTLADGLYANNVLNVGNNAVVFPGVIGQFASNNEFYLQVNLQNFHDTGSSDWVATADIGNDETYFIDMGIQGSNLEDGVLKPLDGYLLVQGDGINSPGGNLIIGTLEPYKNIIFTQGGYEVDNVIAQFVHNTGFHLVKKPITFADGTTQNTSFDGAATAANTGIAYAQSAGNYANAAFTVANTAAAYGTSAGSYANSAFTVANTAAAYGTSAGSYANSAFTKANNALANTTGTFAGSLTVTGNVVSKYALTVNNASMPGNSQYIIVTGTATGAIGTPTNPGYTFHSAVDTGNRIVAEAYSNTASDYSSFIGRRARGTAAAPLAIQNGDTIVRFGGNGYGSTKFSQFSDARIEFIATENHTDSAKGTKIRFLNTQEGSNSATEIATFNANTVSFTGSVNPQKGFTYNPRVLSGNQTAITVDFSTDSIVRATFGATLTISFSNYTYGKIVDVWLTNTAGNGQTVNLGTSANNSTTGATSVSIAAGRSAKLQYFSIDGDNANTFVAVTYA